MEHEVTNIQHQIEEVESQLIQELKDEKDESLDAGDDVDESAIEAETEITEQIENKKSDLEAKKEKAKGKVSSLTSKSSELESTITSTTKKIGDLKGKIEHSTTVTNNLIHEKEEKKQILKGASTSEKTKIQEEIDGLSSQISSNKHEVETWTTERESAITDETTARTELTYTSQSLKKTETYTQHIEEQIVVTDVVIKSKKEKISEETEKKDIVDKQIQCFKSTQTTLTTKEKAKQFRATVNKKLNKKKKMKEDAALTLKSAEEDLKTAEVNDKALDDQIKNTKDKAKIATIKVKKDEI